MPIGSPRELRDHLALAIRVELTTIPPYLYAMYSLADQRGEAARLIRSVVTEEMLHAALMGNVLLAVGGEPRFSEAAQAVRYPGVLPHHIPVLDIDLEPCSREVIERVFLTIERPELHDAAPEADDYESLGQFYHALELAIEKLDGEHDLFADPQLERQLADHDAYRPVAFDSDTSGGLHAVTDLSTARQAIETVIHQGEGVSEERYADPQHKELTHHAKFLELADGTVPLGDVRPAVTNPSTATLPEPAQPVARLTDALYGFTFEILDRIFGTSVAGPATIGDLYATMALLGTACRYLMTLDAGNGQVAGPPFRPTSFDDPAAAAHEVCRIAEVAASRHPALAPVAAAVERLR